MASKYYKLNPKNKTITLDINVNPTPTDEKEVQMYVTAGYIIRHKSEKKAELARERAKKTGFGKKKKEKVETK